MLVLALDCRNQCCTSSVSNVRISLSAIQKASSRITLNLRPLIVTYLLTIADLRRARVDGEILSMAEG